MTPYTSYLVVEDSELTAANMPAPRPVSPGSGSFRGEEKDSAKRIARQDAAPKLSESGGRSFNGGGGKGSASSTPVAAAQAPSADAMASGGDDWAAYEPSAEAITTKTGSTGVAVSRKNKDKREKEVLDRDEVANVTRAGGKTFVWTRGAWIDAEYKGTEKVLKVKYLSEAWFAVVRLHPSIREALSVGDRVIVVTSKGKAIVVNEDGADKIADSEIGKYF